MSQISIIGSGFSGLSAACFLAKQGHKVSVFEKNSSLGGRARVFRTEGFTFDMGPSWYWMPDVFEAFFQEFGHTSADFYTLKRLSPSYRVFFGKDNIIDVPASLSEMKQMFEEREKGSAAKLQQFLDEAHYKYQVGIHKLVYKPGRSLTEFVDLELIKGVFKLQVFTSMRSHIAKYFKHPDLVRLLEFPVLFLGGTPANTPALYSLMNYADIALGTWYPMGGMFNIVEAMASIAKDLGVEMHTNSEITNIPVSNKKATGLNINGAHISTDIIVGSADYEHIEQHLLNKEHRHYDTKYWDSRVMAPSALIYYLGVNKRVKGLLHHNLFFDADFEAHAKEIYDSPQWPSEPLFYVSCPSQTDNTIAPDGNENIFLLMPVAPGIQDNEAIREKYFDLMLNRLEALTGEEIRSHIVYKRSYAHNDFKSDYHSFKGNAYGLANTLMQTAILKPSLKSPKVDNLYFTGQLTVPGPGVPPALISGQVVAQQIQKEMR